MERELPYEMIRRRPSPALAGFVIDLCGYRERGFGGARLVQREAASLVLPLVVSFGSPFSIALDRAPGEADRQPSFAAGLHAGPVLIESDGGAECLQINFAPLGAFRFFGGAVAELAGRMVDIEDIFGREASMFRLRLAETATWEARFAIAETFIAGRLGRAPSSEIAHAYDHLSRSGGSGSISRLSADIGWSRKHFARRFAAEIGMTPKAVARIMRFNSACRIAAAAARPQWSRVAAEAGYADQAHLVREFSRLAGETPTQWAARTAALPV